MGKDLPARGLPNIAQSACSIAKGVVYVLFTTAITLEKICFRFPTPFMKTEDGRDCAGDGSHAYVA